MSHGREVQGIAEEFGCDVSLTRKNHYRITHRQTRRTFFASGTPSDFRSIRNIRAEIKRVVKGLR